MRKPAALVCVFISLSVWAQNARTGEQEQQIREPKLVVNHATIQCRQTYSRNTAWSVPFKLHSQLVLDPSFAATLTDCHRWQYKDANGVCKDKPGTIHCTNNCPQHGYECWDWCLCSEGPISRHFELCSMFVRIHSLHTGVTRRKLYDQRPKLNSNFM